MIAADGGRRGRLAARMWPTRAVVVDLPLVPVIGEEGFAFGSGLGPAAPHRPPPRGQSARSDARPTMRDLARGWVIRYAGARGSASRRLATNRQREGSEIVEPRRLRPPRRGAPSASSSHAENLGTALRIKAAGRWPGRMRPSPKHGDLMPWSRNGERYHRRTASLTSVSMSKARPTPRSRR